MKAKILSLFSLLVLLLVSTSILANGRPTGIRIGRLVSGGGTNVEMDVTVVGTNRFYPGSFNSTYTTVWLGNYINGPWGTFARQDTANGDPLPWGIDWGDGSQYATAPLFGPSGGPFTGTFAHTYAVPGSYVVTVGDAYGPDTGTTFGKLAKGTVPFTGNAISSSYRYVWLGETTFFNTNQQGDNVTFGPYSGGTLMAMTANATVFTGTGIPTLNIYGLLAMSLVLVGAGILVYRRPQRTVV